MTKETFVYGLNACAVTYHNGQKLYEHDELVKCFEDLEMFEKEPCEDAISRQAVLDLAYDMSEIDGEHFTEPYMVVDVEDIQKLPSVIPQPKMGHWKPYLKEGLRYQCSACDSKFATPWEHCPACGTKMQEIENG